MMEPPIFDAICDNMAEFQTAPALGRPLSREALLAALRRRMRTRSIARAPRREYVLRYLNQHPP